MPDGYFLMIVSIKRRLHREICINPVLHGLVLNLYLNGEQYPHRVDDYFPIDAAPDTTLAAQMRSHIADEDRHAAMYQRAIRKLQQPVITLSGPDIYNHVIRARTSTSFAIRPDDSPSKRRLKLAHFFAHLYYLEKRVAKSLEIHADACVHSPIEYSGKVVSRVLSDEHGHVEYTLDAVYHLVPKTVATNVLAEHARAERIANFEFSSQQLKKLVMNHAAHFSPLGRWLYRFSADFLSGARKYA